MYIILLNIFELNSIRINFYLFIIFCTNVHLYICTFVYFLIKLINPTLLHLSHNKVYLYFRISFYITLCTDVHLYICTFVI